MDPDPQSPEGETSERPHDVLAAEEFAVGAGDPALHAEPPRDVLAAEEFALGSEDPALHRRPVEVPPEPGADARPHDVLAADEFAVPAGRLPAVTEAVPSVGAGSSTRGRLLAGGAIAALVTLLWRRRR